MEEKQNNGPNKENVFNKHWYDRYYKLLLLPPVIIFIISLVLIFNYYNQTGDIFIRDSTLSGGTTITVQGDINSIAMENTLKVKYPDVHTRQISEMTSGKPIAIIIESGVGPEELTPAIESYLGYNLTKDNSNIEFTGSTLSQNFYRQLMIAVFFSFLLMSIVIFVLFRTFIPSIAVIFAALADIVMTISFVNFLGIRISAAGIAAFLMLIGYSVDTDILLTTRVLKKKEGTVNQRIGGAMKVGIFMTVTGLLAVLPAFFVITTLPDSFRQIFLILSVGLTADIVNTWLTNASILKWYTVYKGLN